MTSQREVKFRKWYDKFKDDNQVTFGLASEFNECWQAAQADQAEYIALLELNNKFKDDANQKLRDALEFYSDCNHFDNNSNGSVTIVDHGGVADKALGETK